ncbi:hypothetical protein L198_01545 [Cryptococcus wingfieldii CBS 7118]|uniref:G-protein coupled receptors family 1 profile domain-containing protein n=1 Tax=Cryptococcus wingfieldii CBS 7118 TaxID=1295528 RepID=A0A1E3JZW7_9TREE|nr:hypothetical protein L198_01545 [Cryptococcus wingfieldii CBS 7118]ODO06313.1 hypothetical protein L198_01545 [Cryptococcus wingfieldii CBS 7118]
MAKYTLINAWGGTVISATTLVSATYLLILLWKQGTGKLRVRLLMGMIISDLALGLAILPPDIMLILNKKIATGTAGCNALGFVLTTILFTQHLWTLSIAVATFLLLRHPLSRITMAVERYSWLIAPGIWGVSILHAGVWYGKVGFANTGTLCYYGTKSHSPDLDRNLCQFFPRALVFILIIILYSRLFTFLRRPDTIQLSSATGSRLDPEAERASAGKKGSHILRPLARIKRLSSFGIESGSNHHAKEVNPAAPWEALEFIQVGNYNPLTMDAPPQAPLRSMSYNDGLSFVSHEHGRASRPASFLSSPASQLRDTFAGISSNPSSSRLGSLSSDISQSTAVTQGEPFTAELLYNGGRRKSSASSVKFPAQPNLKGNALSPIISLGRYESNIVEESVDSEGKISKEEEVEIVEKEQTMEEFFAETQAPRLDEGRPGSFSGAGGQRSAASYFNRQASLLMLYFPIAYMFVFSASLYRLIYNMVKGEASPVLSIISNWMVFSVGLIDALVYGVAEFMIRRRVRRKMPDRI